VAESDQQHQTPTLDAVYEHLADEIAGWADTLGTDTTYTDPVLEESGSNDWAASLQKSCDWALRTAESLLAVRGWSSQAEDLTRRAKALFDAAEGYEQRLDAMEDQCRVRIEGITAQYSQAFGDDDPDAIQLGRLCQGTQRAWTLILDDHPPETPEQFAEAIDRALYEEQGAKGRAKAEMQRLAKELVEHLRLLARIETGSDTSSSTLPLAGEGDASLKATDPNKPTDEPFGAPEPDPYDSRAVRWLGKRLYLGSEGSQIRNLFMLLAAKPGVPHTLGEVQRAVDGMETCPDEQGKDEFDRSMKRIAKALSKLRKHLRENDLDDHVIIVKEGPRESPSYTLVSRFGN